MTEAIDAAESTRRRARLLTSGRKFNASELQLQLLWFLRDAPAHGYELARRFNDLSGGYYSPSPGALYPALGQLDEQGFARAELAGRRKNFRITAAGLEHLQHHAEQAQVLIEILKHAAKRMLWINLAGESEEAAAKATGWLPEFIQARKALRAALLARDDADHAAQRRIITVLQRATSDIRQVPEAGDTSSKYKRDP